MGDPVTLQAYVSDGLAAEFYWWFTHTEREKIKGVEEERKSVKTACLPDTDCLSSTVVCRTEKISRLCNADVSQN